MGKLFENRGRNIGIDLLRIVSMVMVVILHILGLGGILNHVEFLSISYGIVWFLEVVAYCAVNCYALISGYVGVDSKFRYSNIVQLWIRVFFYLVLITGIFWIWNPNVVSGRDIFRLFFPVLSNQYWYFTSYFCMFFFIPFFNVLLNKLDRKSCSIFIVTIIILFSIVTMIGSIDIFHISDGYSVLWLSSLYFIGGYIKKYKFLDNWSNKKLFFGFLFCVIFTWGSKFLVEMILFKLFGQVYESMYFIRYHSIPILFEAIFLLVLFSRLKIRDSRYVIPYIAKLSFSIYLIHFHPLFKEYLLHDHFIGCTLLPFYLLPFAVFGSAIVICVVSVVIDMMREYLFNVLKVKEFSRYLVNKVSQFVNKVVL